MYSAHILIQLAYKHNYTTYSLENIDAEKLKQHTLLCRVTGL